MNDLEMEMQFADPDWQPGGSPRQQALAVPGNIKHAPDAGRRAEEQPATPIWTPRPGQTPPRTPPSTGADASSGAGQGQQLHQQPAPVQFTGRRQRWLLGFLARLALVVIWLTTPLVTRAFHEGWILPLLGVFFLPVTALTYIVVFAVAGSVTGLGWLWIAGALLLDLTAHARQSSKRSSGLSQTTSKDATPSTSKS